MTKKGKVIIVILLIVLLFACNAFSIGTTKEDLRVIVIDPGHGGIDPGKVGAGNIIEAHINLEVSRILRNMLIESGAIVYMTRESDKGLYSGGKTIREKKREDLAKRVSIAKELGAVVTVSIHCNSFGGPRWHGAQVFFLQGSTKGEELAKTLQRELIRVADPKNTRSAKSNSELYILKNGPDPTVLVELGFLSNPTEAKILQDSSYQNKLAWAIYLGIIHYLNNEGQAGEQEISRTWIMVK
jgi:N-acetylmuramoyl-L-alanine amidase